MFISLTKKPTTSFSTFKFFCKLDFKKRIYKYTFGPAEHKLNNYLLTKYKKDLKSICLALLNEAVFNISLDNDIIIIFKSADKNNLAELITYGNTEIAGSPILRYAFGERI